MTTPREQDLLARCLRLEREIIYLRQGRLTTRRFVTPQERERWQTMRRQGLTCRVIAEECGKPESTISRHTQGWQYVA